MSTRATFASERSHSIGKITRSESPRASIFHGSVDRNYGWMAWLSRMKTTLDLDDAILAEAKRRAAARDMTLKSLVEEALQARLLPRPGKKKEFRLRLPVVEGTAPPAVDVADRRALYDFMEDRPSSLSTAMS